MERQRTTKRSTAKIDLCHRSTKSTEPAALDNKRKKSNQKSGNKSKRSGRMLKKSIYEYQMKSCMTWEFADVLDNIDYWHETLKGANTAKKAVKIELPTIGEGRGALMDKSLLHCEYSEEKYGHTNDVSNEDMVFAKQCYPALSVQIVIEDIFARVREGTITSDEILRNIVHQETGRCLTATSAECEPASEVKAACSATLSMEHASHNRLSTNDENVSSSNDGDIFDLEPLMSSANNLPSLCGDVQVLGKLDHKGGTAKNIGITDGNKTLTNEKKKTCRTFVRGVKVKPNSMGQVNHTTKEKSLKCNFCSKTFSFVCELKTHERTHSGEKPFQCTQCPKMFSQQGVLKRHQRTHSGEKPFNCKQCPKMFSQRGNLETHQRTHSGEKPYKCPQCPKKFSQKGDLKRHQGTHSGEKPYKCTQCPKRFSRRGEIRRHQRTHSGEKPFQCTQCPKMFAQRGVLKSHQRTHSGEKPFDCKQCPKMFSQRGNLEAHQLTHSSEKPYKCSQCPKAFARREYLKKHQRFHSGEKPYKCSLCSKMFSRRDVLKKHMHTHSREKSYKCT